MSPRRFDGREAIVLGTFISISASTAAGASASESHVVAAASHVTAFTGVWKMNPAQSVFTPGPPFRAFTLTFTPDGVRHLALTRATGQSFKADLPWSDGREVDVTVAEGGAGRLKAVSRVSGQVFDDVWTEDGKVIERVHGRQSPDGKTLTVTVEGPSPDGGTYRNRVVFERQ